MNMASLAVHNAKQAYPLTVSGTLVFAAGVYLLGTGYASENPYSFVLAVMLFIALSTLATLGRLQSRSARQAKLEWEAGTPLQARETSTDHAVTATGYHTAPFFRLHFLIAGTLNLGRGASLRIRRDISTHNEPVTPVQQYFPVCGSLHARGQFVIKDIFGMTRAPVSEPAERTIIVRPGHLSDRDHPSVQAQSGQENRSRMKSSDIERYFMREYIPGDRHRDINWKASSRFNELFTRISPVTQEKTQTINIIFRPVNPNPADTLRSVAYLDRCKSELLFFLRSVKTQNPEYQFRVAIGEDLREIEDEEDIDQFALDLSVMHYRSGRSGLPGRLEDFDPSEAFIFTTSYDHSLHELFTDGTDTRTIYRVCVPEKRTEDRTEKLSLLARSTQAMYFGAWALKTDRGLVNPPLPTGSRGRIESIPLEVSLV